MLNWKKAEDGAGYIVRLWNVSEKAQTASLSFTGLAVTAAKLTNMAEVDLPGDIDIEKITIEAKEIINIRVENIFDTVI